VVGIDWPSTFIDLGAVTALLFALLHDVMMIRAEGLNVAKVEAVLIATVRLDMIANEEVSAWVCLT